MRLTPACCKVTLLGFAILLFPLLSGCIVHETEELTITFRDNGPYLVETFHENVGSDEVKTDKREEDFAELNFYLTYKKEFGDSKAKFISKSLEDVNGGLAVRIRAEFSSKKLLIDEMSFKQRNNRYIYQISESDKIVETNGVEFTKDGNTFVSWPDSTRRIHIKTINRKYKSSYSFLKEYRKHIRRPDYFKKKYLKHSMEAGYKSLEGGNKDKAYEYFEDAYRIDPFGSKAREEMLKIKPDAEI